MRSEVPESLSLAHVCRGSGKIYAVVTVPEALEGCSFEARSRTLAGGELPARVVAWKPGRRLLVAPIASVAQRCTVAALDEGGVLVDEAEFVLRPRMAQLKSVVNRLRRDEVILETRDYDDYSGNDGFAVSVERIVDSAHGGCIAQGNIILQGELIELFGPDPTFEILDAKGDDALEGELVVMRSVLQEHPDYPGIDVLMLQFSAHVREGVDSLVVWPQGPSGAVANGPFYVLERSRFEFLRDIWHGHMRAGFTDEAYERWYYDKHVAKQVELSFQMRQRFAEAPLFSVIVPLFHTPPDLFDEMVESVIGQSYGRFELVLVNSTPDDEGLRERIGHWAAIDDRIVVVELDGNYGITENTNRGIEAATGDFLCFLDHDDTLALDALYCYAKAVNEYPETDLLYSDEDKLEDGRYCNPYFKPDWDPELVTGMNYVCHFLCVRKSVVDGLEPATSEYDGAQDYHMTLRVAEQARNIHHVRRVLYHWRIHAASTASDINAKPYAVEAGRRAVQSHVDRCGARGKVVQHPLMPDKYEVVYRVEGDPLVSIVIPNRDNVAVLDRCLRSIVERSAYRNFEIVVVENNSVEETTFEYYRQLDSLDERIRVERFDEPFNFSRVNNFGFERAHGDYLVMLNNDTEVISGDWLERMLGLCMLDGVGAVGVKLLYPDGTVQHAGVIDSPVGPCHVNQYLDCDEGGYFATNVLRHDLNAVTAACLMTTREAFEHVGGMDERFAVDYNDVDFCYALRAAGYRVVFEPTVHLFHYESVSRGFHPSDASMKRFVREMGLLREKWPEHYAFADVYGSPNLDQTNVYYQGSAD